MTIGELTYSLEAVWDKASLKNIQDGLVSVSKKFLTAIGVASASLGAIAGTVNKFADVNDELGKLARNEDIAVDSLQALQYSFESAGVSGSKVGDVLSKLKEQKDGFRTGKADFEAFDRIGINPNAYKNTEDYFSAVVDGLNSISDEAEKSDLSKRILGNSNLKNLIDGGSDSIKKQKIELEELGILISDVDYKESAKFNDTLLKTTTILKGLANKVMTSLIPLFTKLMEQFNNFLKANKNLLTSGLKQFLSATVNILKIFLSLIGRVISQVLSFKPVLILIAGALLLWQLPLIATIVAVTTIFVLLDELFSFLKGENSLIGDWLGVKGIEEFKNKFPKITGTFKAVSAAIVAIFVLQKNTLFNLWDMITDKISFKEAFNKQIEEYKLYFTKLKNIFMDFVNFVTNLFSNLNLFDGIFAQGNKIKNTLLNFIPKIPNIDSIIDNQLPVIGLNKNNKTQPILTTSNNATNNQITNNATNNQITNNYNISAVIDAKNKNISEAIVEISNPEGY